MFLIAGLGNPTAKYEHTRHNVGFDAADYLIDTYRIPYSGVRHKAEHKFKALIGKGTIEGHPVLLAKPQTFMNLSGESIGEIVRWYKLDPSRDMIILSDDVTLDAGTTRIRRKGSAGGHNGMKNIIQHVGSQEFVRIRVGVGKKPDHMDLADYVLSRFGKEDLANIRESCGNACDAVETILADGTVAAMNKFN